jgi:hypothetical protein
MSPTRLLQYCYPHSKTGAVDIGCLANTTLAALVVAVVKEVVVLELVVREAGLKEAGLVTVEAGSMPLVLQTKQTLQSLLRCSVHINYMHSSLLHQQCLVSLVRVSSHSSMSQGF